MIDRDRMLTDLTTAMRRRHTRRRLRRRMAAAFAMIVAAFGVVLAGMPSATPQHETDPVVTVLRNTPRTGLIRTIDDEELLDRLAEIASPTGLIRTEDRVWLTDPPVL